MNKPESRAVPLDGAKVAEEIKSEVAQKVRTLRERYDYQPSLVVVRVGEDPASVVYVRNKVRTSEELGLRSELQVLPADTSLTQLLEIIETLNKRDDVDGILVQLPLPKQIDEATVIQAVDPAKDVDGFHPVNIGRLVLGQVGLVACTPSGIIQMLEKSGIEIRGQQACVVGRSNIVGKPMAHLLLQRDATVTICHSRTRDLPAVTREADILIAAIGRPGLIRGEFIKPGATVIDVGMNRVSDVRQAEDLFGADAGRRVEIIKQKGATLVGDVHPAEAAAVAGRLTPVPGGVGLLTVATLMQNTLRAAIMRNKFVLS
ncbi:MAG TPA: bifunctional 5,10-methylenetetrahydrofolate dehydrogenase/5,10-methenyltetrahydrofolate cyclohydrolase [Pyrinomonadaceae bacterium]|jgi:methylenetetrahydrofolate dehydrogenase (NADP+)/methenyltetrahydrofolate cyclohydrolase|nr:bifunctional 5,10-methylenetetrahydrofolate dehydrogenase/5,10-methenyltetrahydrofolate cyclohydrolase [Pyrinomonadaceae bacterium]